MNREISKIFFEIAGFLNSKEIPFKPYAYQKAALTLKDLKEDVSEIYKKGGLKELENLPGIGKSIAEKIEEYIKKGKIEYYEKLKKEMPVQMGKISAVEGVGPKMVRILYKELGITNVKELEKAAKDHKISSLPGFGEKTEKNIIESINFLKESKGRFLLIDALSEAERIKNKLKELKEIGEIETAGSVRRRKETIGDVDLLATSKNPEKTMDFFVSLKEVVKIWGKGKTKSSVRTREGLDIDLRIIPSGSFGSALQYFTGSKEHNIKTRKIAIKKGLKLNEYGLFKKKKKIAGKTEKEIYHSLGMEWIPPEIREDRGEIESSLEKNLPSLISEKEIKGDLHCHSSWNGGENSISEIAERAMSLGYDYIGVSDHTKFLRIENGLNEEDLLKQRKEIDRLNKKYQKLNNNFRILQGAETNILSDGSLDIKNEALEKLDYVIAGVHSGLKMTEEKMTERIIKAMKNPYVKILAHPTGRLIGQRDAYLANWEEIFKAAKENNIILEVNSNPLRLDLNDENIRKVINMGLKIIINSDAHQVDQFSFIKFGVFQARRGWAEKKDVVNTMSLREISKLFNL
jgi:DNA polymerase (family X)